MSYNYLSLVNEVNRRLNEVEITQVNFLTTVGFHSNVKDSINSALRDIHHSHYEWPFNHVVNDDVLSVGITRYAFPNNANTIDFDSFRIVKNATLGNETAKLEVITYDNYIKSYVDQEYSVENRGVPEKVFFAPGQEYGVVPAPDKAYKVVYDYYRFPVDMERHDDVPTIPERFRHVIIDGAMYHTYMFRSNEQAANISKSKFEEGIKKMRTMLINKNEYMRSTYIQR